MIGHIPVYSSVFLVVHVSVFLSYSRPEMNLFGTETGGEQACFEVPLEVVG